MHHERERQKTENESRKPMFEKPKYERQIKFFNSSGKKILLWYNFETLLLNRTISVTKLMIKKAYFSLEQGSTDQN